MKKSILAATFAVAAMTATAASAVITITQTLDFASSTATSSQNLNQYNAYSQATGSTLTSVSFVWRPNAGASTANITSNSGNTRSFSATVDLTSQLSGTGFTTLSATQSGATGTFTVTGNGQAVLAPLSTLTPSYLTGTGILASPAVGAFMGTGMIAILNSVSQSNFIVNVVTGGKGNFLSSVGARSGGILEVTYSGTDVSPFPEPSSWILMMVGFGGTGALLRRRRRILAQ